MSQSVLDSVAMAYQPVWNRRRRLAAVRLAVHPVQPGLVDATHVMQALGEDWPAGAPVLIVSFSSPELQQQALRCPPVHNTWIEVVAEPFSEPGSLAQLAVAVRSGHQLLRHVPLAAIRGELIAPLDVRSLLQPSVEDALEALKTRVGEPGADQPWTSPIVAEQLYEGLASRALADHCLDEAGAWGVAGWPEDDVLHAWSNRPMGCDAVTILQCRQAIQSDCSLDRLERFVRQDPVLVYRLLALVNSAAFGLRHEIISLRHAIMMLGFTAFSEWLGEQLAGSETDTALHPVRYAQVMRSRLAQHLLESGSEAALRAQVFLTALLGQIDSLLQQPLRILLTRIPLPGRTLDALLHRDGPYLGLVQVAYAQSDIELLQQLPKICAEHDITLGQANRALLRMLTTSFDLEPDLTPEA